MESPSASSRARAPGHDAGIGSADDAVPAMIAAEGEAVVQAAGLSVKPAECLLAVPPRRWLHASDHRRGHWKLATEVPYAEVAASEREAPTHSATYHAFDGGTIDMGGLAGAARAT